MTSVQSEQPTMVPDRSLRVDHLDVQVFADRPTLAEATAQLAANHLRQTLRQQDQAAVILATGQSQLEFLDRLLLEPGIEWGRITFFHMDEYLGLPGTHPASFRRYLKERVEDRIPCRAFHYLNGETEEPCSECDRYANLLRAQPIDLCMLGIGDNGHLAFNDPPVAHFDDPHPVKIVKLDEVCRQQQVNQGHFPSVDAMPAYALTLSIPTLCDSRLMLCLVPGAHKAGIVRRTLSGPIATDCPASILREQPHARLLLDRPAAREIS